MQGEPTHESSAYAECLFCLPLIGSLKFTCNHLRKGFIYNVCPVRNNDLPLCKYDTTYVHIYIDTHVHTSASRDMLQDY